MVSLCTVVVVVVHNIIADTRVFTINKKETHAGYNNRCIVYVSAVDIVCVFEMGNRIDW